MACGCDDLVLKPFEENEIFEIMHKHLGVEYVYAALDEALKPAVINEKLSDESLAMIIKELPDDLIAVLKEATELSHAAMIDR